MYQYRFFQKGQKGGKWCFFFLFFLVACKCRIFQLKYNHSRDKFCDLSGGVDHEIQPIASRRLNNSVSFSRNLATAIAICLRSSLVKARSLENNVCTRFFYNDNIIKLKSEVHKQTVFSPFPPISYDHRGS